MRLNVYSQELILDLDADPDLRPSDPVVLGFDKTNIDGDDGKEHTYSAVRQYFHSSLRLHHPPQDDDRSAITWWLPRSEARREMLARQFEELARLVREAPAETGLD